MTGTAPRIDGALDDEAWNAAEVGENLVQWDPDNGEPLSERTRFQVAYDDRFVYVAIRCDDREPFHIADGLGRRDQMPPTDTIDGISSSAPAGNGWRLILLGMAGFLAAALLLTPARVVILVRPTARA